jgi:tetratricopeptide (TPR) repeat protein
MELIDAAVEIDPYSVRVLWEQCQTNAYLQRTEKSLAVCGRIKDMAPESPIGWYGWGLAHSFSGDMAHATKGFIEAVELDPGDFEMIAAVSVYWITMGDDDQAELWLQRAEAIGAGQVFPIIARLRILKHREQHGQVRDLAGKTLAQNAEDRHGSQRILRQIWAYELARIGNFEGALEPFRKSISWAFEPELVVPDDLARQTNDVIQIAALLKLADPTSERPAQLLEVVEGVTADWPPGWGPWASNHQRAAIATIRGEYETALQWLDRAWDNKWRYMWHETLIEDVVFSQLKNEPGYKNLVARFELDMDQQRELAHELLSIEKEE